MKGFVCKTAVLPPTTPANISCWDAIDYQQTYRYHGDMSPGMAFDFLYNWMSDGQRSTVRWEVTKFFPSNPLFADYQRDNHGNVFIF